VRASSCTTGAMMDDILSLGIVPPYEVLASVRLDKRDIHN
jgi:hypothetical protein